MREMKLKTGYKYWLEYAGEPLIGHGRYSILREIDRTNSLKETSYNLEIAPKTIYNYVKKIESRLGKEIVIARKGGRLGGSMMMLTDLGKELLRQYESAKRKFKG